VGTNGGTQTVDLTVQKLTEPRELRGTVMVVMTDVAPPPATKPVRSRRISEPRRIAELDQELQRAREEVQTTREEMQTSQEELKSTNEELQSTNEELQSTNEELTTSKEEMQSLNEELQTVNHELQSKVDELSRSNNDMKNLLNSTDIATLFLDGELRVRRFTTPTAKIIKLIPGDAGRPITDIVSDLEYGDLADDAREVLRTLVYKEKPVATRDGRWFAVRIMPYRTLENVIDGVVITFTDASASRALEIALREQTNQLRQMADVLPSLVWGCRPDGTCDYLSGQWVEYTGVPDTEQLGFGWLEQVHAEDRERVRDAWRAAVKSGSQFDLEFRLRSARGEYHWFRARSVPIRDSAGHILKWYGANTDIEDLKVRATRHGPSDGLGAAIDNVREGILALDHHLAITFLNPAAARMLGRDGAKVVGRKLLEAFPELRKSEIDERIRRALKDKAPASFETQLKAEPYQGRWSVRIFPLIDSEGISVLLERSTQHPPSRAPERKG
jgi:two-component system CheB/CheR fusion protein